MPERVLVPPIESALDYLTVTGRHADHRRQLRDVGHQLVRELQADGHDARGFTWKGYQGETCEWCTWGERDDGTLLRISGPWSNEYFDTIYPMADNVSRIDLAVTANVGEIPNDLAADTYRLACASARLRGRPLRVAYTCDSEGGSTVYLGRRVSDLFARLYNKEAESRRPEYVGCWRWELETKGSTAKHYADNLAGCTNRAGLIGGTVADHFGRRGAPVMFDSQDMKGIRPLPLERSDDDRRMKWLKNQVAPILGKMSARVPAHELASLLGLSATVSASK